MKPKKSRKEWKWQNASNSVKPTRNRYFCPDCGREKTVFKSDRAAQKFIEYSRKSMIESSGYAPERVYYCDLCCGWHVTSKKVHTHKNFHRIVVDTMMDLRKAREEFKKMKKAKVPQKPNDSPVTPFLSEAMRMVLSAIGHVRNNEIHEAKELCSDAQGLFNKMAHIKGASGLRRRFMDSLTRLQCVLKQNPCPKKSDLERIADSFESTRHLAPDFFCYDPEVHVDMKYEVTPANIDGWLSKQPAESTNEEAKEYANIIQMLMAVDASMACGDMADAETSLRQAIEGSQKLASKRELGTILVELTRLVEKFKKSA